jgi:NCAIR mutase (PurE)-related protein
MGVRSGEIPLEHALERLAVFPYEDLGYARVDHHRSLRNGFPEIVYGDSKTPQQIAEILASLASANPVALCSRASPEAYAAVRDKMPHAIYHPGARMIVIQQSDSDQSRFPGVTVVSAGTGDLSVADEAAITSEAMGHEVVRITDVGVAGLHRVLGVLEQLRSSNVLVVVAGMEGALPSVVAGLVEVPVIAVPTSVGYGTSFGGLASLLTMLNSCAAGVAVVNIDNGVGAGALAARINRQAHSDPATPIDPAAERPTA